MPEDYNIVPSDPSEPRFSEEDLDAALDVIRARADDLGDEVAAALMVETAEHYHQFLLNER